MLDTTVILFCQCNGSSLNKNITVKMLVTLMLKLYSISSDMTISETVLIRQVNKKQLDINIVIKKQSMVQYRSYVQQTHVIL